MREFIESVIFNGVLIIGGFSLGFFIVGYYIPATDVFSFFVGVTLAGVAGALWGMLVGLTRNWYNDNFKVDG